MSVWEVKVDGKSFYMGSIGWSNQSNSGMRSRWKARSTVIFNLADLKALTIDLDLGVNARDVVNGPI
jgi:hypothetical protein